MKILGEVGTINTLVEQNLILMVHGKLLLNTIGQYLIHLAASEGQRDLSKLWNGLPLVVVTK